MILYFFFKVFGRVMIRFCRKDFHVDFSGLSGVMMLLAFFGHKILITNTNIGKIFSTFQIHFWFYVWLSLSSLMCTLAPIIYVPGHFSQCAFAVETVVAHTHTHTQLLSREQIFKLEFEPKCNFKFHLLKLVVEE